ncbi:hypothetical protein OEZ86_011203 [Tetradesmus obliquus]|uniref:DAPG hydrolase PhiG domain-containing protein n=1 Tax=Tetradesmus obliquus TaxID=3088 RepID=A0ABY8TJL2_TETOB|nr:hypothetical protein OEZ85_008041 [Tetradesmus obliquus]WIA28667.1 hypothetical protein OEZ86_011203 [Tetradesmus obliquus]
MQWWFRQNLERVVYYPWDGGNYTRYQMWHPRDHCHQKAINRTTWLLQEFIVASKNFTRKDFQGFNASSEAQINLNMSVRSLNATGLTLSYVIYGFEMTKLTHTWRNTAKGLDVTSELWVGNPSLQPQLNQVANCAFSRGQDPLAVARKLQQHTVEEFGNLEKVLPYLYSVRNVG